MAGNYIQNTTAIVRSILVFRVSCAVLHNSYRCYRTLTFIHVFIFVAVVKHNSFGVVLCAGVQCYLPCPIPLTGGCPGAAASKGQPVWKVLIQ